ncbi:MAG: hypothetical protein HQK61_10310 [Desulfamplus sp.]|nr:hypothetical protein [Desulfamplus sp.]
MKVNGIPLEEYLEEEIGEEARESFNEEVSSMSNSVRGTWASHKAAYRAKRRPLFDDNQSHGEVVKYEKEMVTFMNKRGRGTTAELLYSFIALYTAPEHVTEIKKEFLSKFPDKLSDKSTSTIDKALIQMSEAGVLKRLTLKNGEFYIHRKGDPSYYIPMAVFKRMEGVKEQEGKAPKPKTPISTLSPPAYTKPSTLLPPPYKKPEKEVKPAQDKNVFNEPMVSSLSKKVTHSSPSINRIKEDEGRVFSIYDDINEWMDKHDIAEFSVSIRKRG